MGLQYGIHEVCNLNIVDFASKKPLLYADYAEVSSNETTGETTTMTGGIGMGVITTRSHSKKSNLKVTLPAIDLKMLAILAGDDIAEGAANAFQREVLTVSGGKVTLAQTPLDGTLFVNELTGLRDIGAEYTEAASAPTGQQYSISAKDITFDATENGKQVVVFYQYTTQTGAQTISIKSNKFAKAVTIYGDGVWSDLETETDKAIKVVAYKAKPQPNFTLSMAGTEFSKLEMTFDLFTVKDQATGDLKYIDYIVLP
jgi:hypothetical protein